MNGSPDSAHSSSDAAKVRPDGEELRAKLDQWILWVREHIATSGDIPTVIDLFRAAHDPGGENLLLDCMPDRMSVEKLERFWGDILTQSHGDLAARAAVLSCAWLKVAFLESELNEWGNPPDPEEILFWGSVKDDCERARETLALLVRFLSVEDCARTWRNTRWEILNSYIIRDWDRAIRLYNRADDLRLKNSDEVAALRGQFRFLAVLGVRKVFKEADIRLGLDSLFWEPRIYRAEASDEFDQLRAELLFKNGMCDSDRELVLKGLDKAMLMDAASDLQKAFLSVPLPYPYRAILGRCCYSVGDFHNAAEQYKTLLQSEGQCGQPKASAELFASLSMSYREAGETGRAKEILERWAREFPGEKGVYLQLAKLEAQGADYQAAVEYLRKEIDRNPALDTDWKLSALLALGTTQDTSEAIKNELKDNSDLWNPVCSMLNEYWGPFSKLSEKGREKWTFGTVLASSSRLPERMRLNEAAVACLAAVEIELRDRLFSKYKEHVLKHASLRTTAENGLSNSRSHKLCEFLVHDRGLTLGEMAFTLKVCGKDDEPVLRDLRNWIDGTQSRVMKNLGNLEALVAFRNPAVHGNRIEGNPKGIIQSCRAFIEALN